MKYLFHWGSHIPVLMKLLEVTKKDVLEIGMGIYSTPLLHWVCLAQNRKLVSIENHEDYFNMFVKERNPMHKRYLIPDLSTVNVSNRQWDIAFIDCEPSLHRREFALKLIGNTKFIALHDSEEDGDKYYLYSRIYPKFKYMYNCTRFIPNTVVLSNTENLEFLHGY